MDKLKQYVDALDAAKVNCDKADAALTAAQQQQADAAAMLAQCKEAMAGAIESLYPTPAK